MVKDYSIFKGQNLFQMLLMYSVMFGIMALVISYTQVVIHGWTQFAITSAITVVVNAAVGVSYFSVYIKKLNHVGGKHWLSGTMIKDVDYAEDKILGIKDISLLDFKLESDTDIVGDKKQFESLLETLDFNDDKIQTWLEDFINQSKKDEEILTNEKEKEVEMLCREKPINDLVGEYIYAVSFMEENSFEDSENHTFDTAIIVTRLPYGAEFKFATTEIYFQGWWLNALTTKCVLDIEEWITGDKPLIHVEWSMSESLNKKRQKISQKPARIFIRTIKSMKEVINQLRDKLNRSDTREDELQNERENLKKEYQHLQQEFYRVRSSGDWLTSKQVDPRNMFIKKWLFGLLVFVICGLSVAVGILAGV